MENHKLISWSFIYQEYCNSPLSLLSNDHPRPTFFGSSLTDVASSIGRVIRENSSSQDTRYQTFACQIITAWLAQAHQSKIPEHLAWEYIRLGFAISYLV